MEELSYPILTARRIAAARSWDCAVARGVGIVSKWFSGIVGAVMGSRGVSLEDLRALRFAKLLAEDLLALEAGGGGMACETWKLQSGRWRED